MLNGQNVLYIIVNHQKINGVWILLSQKREKPLWRVWKVTPSYQKLHRVSDLWHLGNVDLVFPCLPPKELGQWPRQRQLLLAQARGGSGPSSLLQRLAEQYGWHGGTGEYTGLGFSRKAQVHGGQSAVAGTVTTQATALTARISCHRPGLPSIAAKVYFYLLGLCTIEDEQRLSASWNSVSSLSLTVSRLCLSKCNI